MLDLNSIFHFTQDQGPTNFWKAQIGEYELFAWVGGRYNSIPEDKSLQLNDYSSFSFKIITNEPSHLAHGYFSSKEMIDLFGLDFLEYPYRNMDGFPNEGCNVPIDIVKHIVEKAILLTNPFPKDAGDGE